MDDKLSFDEVELNYILEAVQYFRDHGSIAGTDMAVYSTELDNIEERILDFLNS
jgi:hypothetical protein